MFRNWQPGKRTRGFLQATGLALAVLLVCTGPVIADTVEERLQSALDKIEGLVTKLALDDSLDAQETEALRSDLAAVYRELHALKSELTPPAPVEPAASATNPAPATTVPDSAAAEVSEPVAPTAPAADWQIYAKAKAVVTPPDAKFTGWREAADISFRWGEYGQIILQVANADYEAQWTIDEAYHGSVNVSTQTQPEGGILIQVTDDLGQHEYLLQGGGLGPLQFRQTSVNSIQPASPAPVAETPVVQASAPSVAPAPAEVWYLAYREQVANGSLTGSEALEWFISQYEAGQYADGELAELGDCLRALGSEARPILGRLMYTNDGQPRSIEIPDPRVNPVSFVQIMNRIFGFKASGDEFAIELS
jgi:hypothetical protein